MRRRLWVQSSAATVFVAVACATIAATNWFIASFVAITAVASARFLDAILARWAKEWPPGMGGVICAAFLVCPTVLARSFCAAEHVPDAEGWLRIAWPLLVSSAFVVVLIRRHAARKDDGAAGGNGPAHGAITS